MSGHDWDMAVAAEASRHDGVGPVDLVVVVASAGGVEVLKRLVADLPADLPAAVLLALHLPSGARSVLADILGRRTPLVVRPAVDGAPLRPGCVLVAGPDHLPARRPTASPSCSTSCSATRPTRSA